MKYETGKTTAIRRIAVRETGISRHNKDPIEGLPESTQTITVFERAFKGPLIIPRDARCIFFTVRLKYIYISLDIYVYDIFQIFYLDVIFEIAPRGKFSPKK